MRSRRPEVEAIAGDLTGSVAFLADHGSTFADNATGRLWVEDDDLNAVDIIEGTAPLGGGQIAVDRGLADEHGLAVGADVTILTLGGEFPASDVGVTAFGDSDAIDPSGTVSISPVDAFDWLNSGQVEFTELRVRGNVSEAELQAAIEPLAPPGFVVQTGDDYRQDKRSEVTQIEFVEGSFADLVSGTIIAIDEGVTADPTPRHSRSVRQPGSSTVPTTRSNSRWSG